MKKLILICSIAVLFANCNKFDDDLNVSPTALAEPTTRGLLTNSIQAIPNLVLGGTAVSRNGSLYVQYLSEGPYPGPSLYSDRTFSFSDWYTGPLFNLQKIIEYNNEGSSFADPGANGSKDNQIAVARILKAYLFLNMTDRWGDIPYSQALQGDKAFSPVYDKQQDIYTDLFKELTEAAAQIKEGENAAAGDILLGGDMAAWKRFANTTRMIMGLRLSKVDPAKGMAEYASAVAGGVISSNAENIDYQFIAGDPNNYNPWYNNYSVSFRNDYALSTTLAGYMASRNDPRLAVYGETLSNGSVKGLPYGRNAAVNIPAAYSRIGDRFRGAGSPLNIYSYAQVLFMMAEAAKIGYMAGGDATAAIHYADAIKASWEQYGVFNAGAYAAYMANAGVVYSPASGYEQIMTEKWVHMYLNGWEAWNDWRRTGYPVLTQAVDAVDPKGIPRRLAYPTTEKALNGVNYTAAIAAMGGTDDNYARLWWDKP
jgi:hypothetical protein